MQAPAALRRVFAVLNSATLSADARGVLDQEEVHGARISNVFRYAFFLLVGPPLVYISLTSNTGAGGRYINLAALSCYLALTGAHSIILRRGKPGLVSFFHYFTMVADFAVVLTATLAWTAIYSPDNMAFALKNTGMAFLIMPIALSVIQFRIRMVTTALALYILAYGGVLAYGFYQGMPTTRDWREYSMGPAVVVADIVFARPALVLFLAITSGYAVYRSIYMIRRIGHVESQKASLARYFSPDVVQEITTQPEVLGSGQRQKVTVLFSDIRNFTRMSEGMDPDALASFLTEYRARMTRTVFENGGTLDKFVGDAVMATFGTPRPASAPGADSRNAVAAARAMISALESWNAERSAGGLAEVRIGIGIHTGEVFAGTIGSEGRLEYTVIGDAVNTASRIESLCKKFNAVLLISEQVYAETDPGPAERMPRVLVKGKEEPVRTYKLA